MTLQELKPLESTDMSMLSLEERLELIHFTHIEGAYRRLPRKVKKRKKKLTAKTTKEINYYTQSEIDDILCF